VRRLGLGATGAAVVAALLVPGHRAGLGLTAAALAVAAAGWREREAAGDGGGRLDTALDRAPAVLALVLCLAAAVRDAGWVVAVSVAGAIALGSLAAAGGRTWPAVVRGLVAAPRAAAAGAVAVAEGVGALVPRGRVGETRPVARGAAVAVVLAGVFGALFASADAAFAQIAGDVLTPGWDLGSLGARAGCAALAALATGALAVTAARPVASDGAAARVGRLGRTEWAIALGVLDALFAAFVAVQVTAMFGGADHILQTAGLTYAQYAREGFAQLLVVAALTLAVTALAGAVAPRALTAALLALTLVVVASALHRLDLYQQAFGFTRLRLSADAIGLWLGALIVVVLVAGASAGARPRLPRAAVAVSALVLAAFVAINPDGYIAARNVERQARTGRLDLAYARSLSADAAGALARLPAPLAACALAPLRERLAHERDGLGGANVSRARARRALRGAPSRCSP
jgi:Domain of unknown function (DUF4173)